MNRITTHPGEILEEEFLKPLGISARRLSLSIGVPHNRLGEIVRQKRSITADTALRLGRAFNMSAEFWMNAQSSYDITKEQMDKKKELDKIQPVEVA